MYAPSSSRQARGRLDAGADIIVTEPPTATSDEKIEVPVWRDARRSPDGSAVRREPDLHTNGIGARATDPHPYYLIRTALHLYGSGPSWHGKSIG